MRLIHISDLHFGAHDDGLRRNLLQRVKAQPPDLIVCTGDLADEPNADLMNRARQFLSELSNDWSIPAIVVPGNHDYRAKGFLKGNDKVFSQFFGSRPADVLVETPKANVWVFGFDSARDGTLGGSGKIGVEDLQRFHAKYEDLQRREPGFDRAFKVVAVHHHPLPVDPTYSQTQRWLTMTNAGEFMSALLFRKIDLLLHGHEHLQGNALFQSSLANNEHRVNILSLGATLRNMPNRRGNNWFGILEVDDSIGTTVKLYSSGPDVWEPQPAKVIVIETAENVREFSVRKHADKEGYCYHEINSFTLLNRDGDARRIVECSNLVVNQPTSQQTFSHKIELPETLGFIEGLVTKGKDFSITLRNPLPPGQHVKSWTAHLDFDKPMARADYKYGWWAINAFAMNSIQIERLYKPPHEKTEYTNFIVIQPVQYLAIHLQYPDKYPLPGRPQARVSRAGSSPTVPWERDARAEVELESSGALEYFELLHLAVLRVKWPLANTSYGIEWTVPELPSYDDLGEPDLEVLRDIWLRRPLDRDQRDRLLRTLSQLGSSSLQLFCEGWNGPLNVSVMFYDGVSTLAVLAAANMDANGVISENSFERVSLSYGLGVAGRAFKVNEMRVYKARGHLTSAFADPPDAYEAVPGTTVHKVMVSFPLHTPVTNEYLLQNPHAYEARVPYGVLNIGSKGADCPLGTLSSRQPVDILSFQHSINQTIFEVLKEVFLERQNE